MKSRTIYRLSPGDGTRVRYFESEARARKRLATTGGMLTECIVGRMSLWRFIVACVLRRGYRISDYRPTADRSTK